MSKPSILVEESDRDLEGEERTLRKFAERELVRANSSVGLLRSESDPAQDLTDVELNGLSAVAVIPESIRKYYGAIVPEEPVDVSAAEGVASPSTTPMTVEELLGLLNSDHNPATDEELKNWILLPPAFLRR